MAEATESPVSYSKGKYMSNDRLSTALGVHYCQGCDTEIPNWVLEVTHKGESLYHVPSERNWYYGKHLGSHLALENYSGKQ